MGTKTTHYVFMDRSLLHTKAEDIPSDKVSLICFTCACLHSHTYAYRYLPSNKDVISSL